MNAKEIETEDAFLHDNANARVKAGGNLKYLEDEKREKENRECLDFLLSQEIRFP